MNMSELANSLGIDGKKYLQIISSNDEKKFDIIITNNNLQIVSKIGLLINCFHCNYKHKINIIYDNTENIKEVFECKYCKNLNFPKTIENNNLRHIKNLINKYFLNTKKCSKCNNSSRLFLRKK